MKSFSELSLSQFWSEFVVRWKRSLLISPEARAKGFDSETGVEEVIAVFIDALEEERKIMPIKRVAFDEVRPWRITFDGERYHEIHPYGGRMQRAPGRKPH